MIVFDLFELHLIAFPGASSVAEFRPLMTAVPTPHTLRVRALMLKLLVLESAWFIGGNSQPFFSLLLVDG